MYPINNIRLKFKGINYTEVSEAWQIEEKLVSKESSLRKLENTVVLSARHVFSRIILSNSHHYRLKLLSETFSNIF
jgi:hypothetical protein